MIAIRPLQAEDAEVIVKFNESTDEDFMRQWAGRFYTYPLTKEQIIERIKNTENTRYFTVLLDNAVIGMAELDFIKWDERVCSVCRFILGVKYRGKRYGAQALDLLCNYAFNELGMQKVKLSVFDFNIGAYKCYLNSGFRVVGEAIRPNGWKAIEMEKVKNMELVFPTIEHKQNAWEYRQEHIDYGETHIHGSSGFMKANTYEEWLEKITWNQNDATPDWVTGSVYFAVIGGRIIGTIAVRHYLNDSLLNSGGHIGYGIRPSERRKGYGAQMLTLALEKCREFGIDKALITCDKNNIASAKTAIKNGATLENEITEDNGNILQRYWITL